MFYRHFYLFVWLCIIFGIGKTSITSKGIIINKPSRVTKLWPLFIIGAILICYVLTNIGFEDFTIKRDLEKISCLNDVAVNVLIVFVVFFISGKHFNALYDLIDSTIKTLKLSNKTLIVISRKVNVYIFLVTVSYMILICGEIMTTSAPFIFVTRIPFCLAILHLSIHLYIILVILKIINLNLSVIFKIKGVTTKGNIFGYVFNPEIKFINVFNHTNSVDIKFLFKIYDNLYTSLQLLQNIHGVQVLLSIWLMLSSAVVAITLIACDQANPIWLVTAKAITPFAWCLMGCYIEDQLFKETERTEILIMKYIIDYRCDTPKRSILKTFKQLVTSNRLQFTACNLFGLNYSMILGTIMNVITYSIILVQLFLSD